MGVWVVAGQRVNAAQRPALLPPMARAMMEVPVRSTLFAPQAKVRALVHSQRDRSRDRDLNSIIACCRRVLQMHAAIACCSRLLPSLLLSPVVTSLLTPPALLWSCPLVCVCVCVPSSRLYRLRHALQLAAITLVLAATVDQVADHKPPARTAKPMPCFRPCPPTRYTCDSIL